MTNPKIQIGDEVREMTDAEYAQWQTDNEAHAAQAAAVEAQAAARASALTKLAELGLTEAEVAAILGG
jgi:D-alanyl-D-alanine carboxypeptidase